MVGSLDLEGFQRSWQVKKKQVEKRGKVNSYCKMTISGTVKANDQSWVVGEKDESCEETDNEEIVRVQTWGQKECNQVGY